MPNNNLSHDENRRIPLPRDYQGGSGKFNVVRTLDGHAGYAVPEWDDSGDGSMSYSYANAHSPTMPALQPFQPETVDDE